MPHMMTSQHRDEEDTELESGKALDDCWVMDLTKYTVRDWGQSYSY
jgi:hypothetical protein